MSFRTQYGIDNLFTENISFSTPIHGDGFGANGSATNSYSRRERWNWQNILQYDFKLGEKHNLSVLAGTPPMLRWCSPRPETPTCRGKRVRKRT
jgi:hypothetical protein